jgi:hypothetical protein
VFFWDLGSQDLALNEAGEGVIAWRAADRPEDDSSGVIRASVSTRDGSWESPLNSVTPLADRGTEDGGRRARECARPLRTERPHVRCLPLCKRLAADDFATGIGWENYDVVMNRRGDALAVWGDQDGQMISARRPAATGSWSSPVRVPVTSPLQGLGASFGRSFALDEQGSAILVEVLS